MALPEHLAILPEEVRDQLATRDRRSTRYRRLSVLWRKSSRKRVRECSHRAVPGADYIELGTADGKSSVKNLLRCASIHACPVCAPRIRDGRAAEIDHAARAHLAQGGKLLFVTLTLPHVARQSLKGLLGDLTDSWREVRRSSMWETWGALYGIELQAREGSRPRTKFGDIRAVDHTHGANGWHPHLHLLVFVSHLFGDELVDDFAKALHHEWAAQVTRRGHRSPTRSHGVDVRMVDLRKFRDGDGELANYLAKTGGGRIDLELARTDLKRGHRSRTPWQILRDLCDAYGDVDGETGELAQSRRYLHDLDLWWEYEYATHRTNVITWTHGLKRRFDVHEVTDQELAEESVGHRTVLSIEADAWYSVVRARLIAPLRSAVEAGDREEIVEVLILAGVDLRDAYWGPPPPEPD